MSGLEGTFINASLLDLELPGRWARPSRSRPRAGARTKNYQIAITEPYFFDRPITAGFDLFKRKITY